MTYLRLVSVADEMRSTAFSGWPAEPQQCCAATPGQSSCVQLCAAVRAVRTWGGSARARGAPILARSRELRGHRGSPALGTPWRLGQAEAVLGCGLAEGLTGSCGIAGAGAAGPGGLTWGPGLPARQGRQTRSALMALTDYGFWVNSFEPLTEGGKSLTLGIFCHI